jgi:phosphoenolpyruvate phosphomutase
MRALILGSGEGRRLRPLTKWRPKLLLKIGGNTLLGHQLESLIDQGVRDVIITTGPFGERVKKYVAKNYPVLNASFVKNPHYRTTNYIYSMWLARRFVDDDVLLLHGDLIFEKGLPRKLLHHKSSNCVLVNKRVKPPEKDFKAVIDSGRVVKIGVEFFGKNAFFLVPIYKFAKRDFGVWLKEIEKAVRAGDLKIYAETVFNKISDKIMLRPVYFTKEFCMEIDTKQDLELAERMLVR